MKPVIHLFCLLFFLFFAPSANFAQVKPPSSVSEYEERFSQNQAKDRINGVYIPRNLDDAMLQLDKRIDPKAKEALKTISEETAAHKLHFSLGRWMIVNWNLYEGSRYANYLSSAGVTYPDDMADFTIRAYHRYASGHPMEFKELAKSYRQMRKEQHQKELEAAPVVKELSRKKKDGGKE